MIIFVIPARNEEENIALLLSNLKSKAGELGAEYRIILVNDGSTDSTKKLAEGFKSAMPLEIIDLPGGEGVGEVFKAGFSRALQIAKDSDTIITKEADNTSDLDILDEMLKEIGNGNDLVLASCYAPGGKIIGTTLDRVILSSGANLLLKMFFPIRGVCTYSSFYRAYKAGMLKKAFYAYDNRLIEYKGFTCMVELLIKLSRLPISIKEVPMVLRCDLRKGRSKMNKGKTLLSYFSLIGKEAVTGKGRINGAIKRYKNA
jgi:dolichol-phosphate mannosyltransferase